MKRYEARTFGNVFVWEDGKRRVLPPRLDLANHSPTGLSWGYHGSGCAQLALALLADVYDDERAFLLYERFAERAIFVKNKAAPFEMTAAQVMAFVEKIEKEPAI
jgi:hypothetical protein